MRLPVKKILFSAPLELSNDELSGTKKPTLQLKEEYVESSKPGEQLCQEILCVRSFNGIGKLYLHTVVDTNCGFSFGMLSVLKLAGNAITLLHKAVLPFYKKCHLRIEQIITSERREFGGRGEKSYENYLKLNGILHQKMNFQHQSNTFLERFRETTVEKFIKLKLKELTVFDSIEAIQQDFEIWLQHYNNEPQPSNGNYGKSPSERIVKYLESINIST